MLSFLRRLKFVKMSLLMMYLCCSTTVKSKYDWASDLWLQPASASELEKDTVNCGSQLKFIIEEAPVLLIRK